MNSKTNIARIAVEILLLVVICFFIFDGRKDSGELNSLTQRITQLEHQNAEMKIIIENIDTIVSAAQTGDCIKDVVILKNGDEQIGYKIYFAVHDPIIIYHGKDGKDGINYLAEDHTITASEDKPLSTSVDESSLHVDTIFIHTEEVSSVSIQQNDTILVDKEDSESYNIFVKGLLP